MGDSVKFFTSYGEIFVFLRWYLSAQMQERFASDGVVSWGFMIKKMGVFSLQIRTHIITGAAGGGKMFGSNVEMKDVALLPGG